jgi:hypothetical protein
MDRLIEPLEGRRLLSSAPPMSITLAAQGADNVLTINNAANVQLHEFVNSSGNSVHVTSNNGLTNHGFFDRVTKIVINGTNGDDAVRLDDADIEAFISTFNGKDVIVVTNVAATVVTNPELVTVDAGNGKDTIIADTSGPGTITTVVLAKGKDTVEALFA